MKIKQLIREALSLLNNVIAYYVSQNIAAISRQKALLESNDSSFNLKKYVSANLCNIQQNAYIHNHIITGWNGMDNKVYEYSENISFEVIWQGHKFDVLLISWRTLLNSAFFSSIKICKFLDFFY
ncbi:MAG: hypothetical protein V7L20_04055 [Nostoc sp.]|uniref:hypothetical protein n=1 Tax=Nostoc sp. TaxID=1180 RepID=UPI002FF70C0A